MSGRLEPGVSVGPYRVDAFVGRGGMGVVYAAEHITLGRRVALKLVAPELVADEGFRERFLREARLAASLEHPNIIPVYDAGEDGDRLYLAMRFVEGENLGAVLEREHALDPGRALRILGKVAEALDEAHRNGLVHRDVKPDNILLAWGERSVFLTDFGLVRRLDSSTRLTKTGYMMGTLSYMAPEILKGEGIDARTDVYSLACVLFECLTGSPPFVRPTEPAVISSHLIDPPPVASLVRPGLPSAIDPVIARGMAKERTDRFPTCGELIEAAATALRASALGGEVTSAPAPAEPTVPRPASEPVPGPSGSPPMPMPPPPSAPPSQGEASPGGPPARPRASWRPAAIAAAAVVVLGLAGFLVLRALDGGEGGAEQTGRTTATTTGAATGPTAATGATGSTGSPGEGPSEGVRLIAVVPGTPTFVDVAAGAVWVTVEEGSFVRVDKGSGTITEVPLDASPSRSTFTGNEARGDAWVVSPSDGSVTRVPLPAGSQTPVEIPVGAEPARSIAPPATGAVWVAVSGEDLLVRIDARTGETLPVAVGDRPVGLAATRGSIWVANAGSGTVSRVDQGTLEVLDDIAVGEGPTSLQPADPFIYVANTDGNSVSVLNPVGNTVIVEIPVGARPTGVTNDQQGGVWVQNREGDSLSRVDTVTRTSEEFPLGAAPVSMTKAGDALWLVVADGRLVRIEPTTGAMTSLDLGIDPVSISPDVDAVWIVGRGGEVLRAGTDVLP